MTWREVTLLSSNSAATDLLVVVDSESWRIVNLVACFYCVIPWSLHSPVCCVDSESDGRTELKTCPTYYVISLMRLNEYCDEPIKLLKLQILLWSLACYCIILLLNIHVHCCNCSVNGACSALRCGRLYFSYVACWFILCAVAYIRSINSFSESATCITVVIIRYMLIGLYWPHTPYVKSLFSVAK